MERDLNKKTVPIGQAAEFLGVSVDTVRRWDEKGILHSQRPDGKDRYFSLEELEKVKFSEPLTISEAAQKLDISEATLRRLEKKDLIKPARNSSGDRIYTIDCLEDFLRSDYYLRKGVIEDNILSAPEDNTGEDKADFWEDVKTLRDQHRVLSATVEEQNKHIRRLNIFRKIFHYSFTMFFSVIVILVVLFTVLFLLYPTRTAKWFGLDSQAAQAMSVAGETVVKAGGYHSEVSQPGFFSKVLQPVGGLSLEIVRQINPETYSKIIAERLINDVNDIFTVNADGDIVSKYNLITPNGDEVPVIIPAETPVPTSVTTTTTTTPIDPAKESSWDSAYLHITDTSNPHGVTSAQVLPSQSGKNGMILSTNGSSVSWIADSAAVAWGVVGGTLADQADLVAALAAKEATVSAGTTAQYYRGDKSWATLNSSAVGLGNVDNTSDTNKPVSSATQTALDAKQGTLPSQTGQNGKVLGTNGSALSWITNSSGVAWGAITGTLTDQSDLVLALAAKQNSLSEGTDYLNKTNLDLTYAPISITQYTDEMAQDALGNAVGAGLSYNDTTGAIASTITQYTDALARAAISETITGLDYSSTTGVISTTTGYVIPTTTEESNWNTAYGWGSHASAGYYVGDGSAFALALGADDNYVTDAEKIVIGNTSGTNTGDNATNSQYSGLATAKADVGQTFYLGTTQVAINRGTGALSLLGVSIDGNAGTVTNGVYTTGADSVYLTPGTAGSTYLGILAKSADSDLLDGHDTAYFQVAGSYQADSAVLTELTALTDPAANRVVAWNDTSNNFEFLDYANWNTAYGWGNHAGLYESSGAVATHAALQTGVHGISITAGKTFSSTGTLTIAGTDGSTLTIGTGGTLGTAAYTASTAYAAALGADDNYVTDAEKVVIGNTSGTNTGDNAANSLYSGLAASKQDVVTWGDGLEATGATAAVDLNTTNLKFTTGELDTIQGISTAASPTFANLTNSGLSAGRVTFAGTAGLLSDSASMTFDVTNGLILAAGSASALQLSSTDGTEVGGIMFGPDTNLYRLSDSVLRTDDAFSIYQATSTATGLLLSGVGTGGGVLSNEGVKLTLSYNAAGNRQLTLYDSAQVGSLTASGFRYVLGFDLPTIDSVDGTASEVHNINLGGLGGKIGIGFNVTTAAQADITNLLTLVEGTTAEEGIGFGTDTNLYRSAADTLKTDDALTVVGATTLATSLTGLLEASSGLVSTATADVDYQQTVTWGDGLEYSAGTAAVDYNTTNLKITATELDTIQGISTAASPTFANLTDSGLTATRVTFAGTAGILTDSASMIFNTTNGLVLAAGSASALKLSGTDNAATSGILFGTDTNLYRSAASTLKTDDAFTAVGDIYTAAWTDYTATSTVIGWTEPLTIKQIRYKKVGKLVFVAYYLTGTSNSTTTTFSLPYTNASGFTVQNAQAYTENNGTTEAVGVAYLPNGSTTVNLRRNPGSVLYGNANGKSAAGQFWYEASE